MTKNNYEQMLKDEIKKSDEMIIKEAEKEGSKRTTEQLINRCAKKIHQFTSDFWIYNKIMAEKELKGYRKAKRKILKVLKEVKESKELYGRYDKKTIINLCGYLEGEMKDG